jgi:fumarylacetoacetate (FAA) hydrolase
MKFCTIDNGTPDGRVCVVSADGARVQPVSGAETMQELLENWESLASGLAAQYEAVNGGAGETFEQSAACSPLPRAWQWLDGSAFETHALLLQQAWGMPVVGLNERPLMYQGLSNEFLPPHGIATFPSVADGIDFEGEYGVILDAVPMGTKARDAAQYIRLVVMINDWSLRALGPVEMATGFGWLQCKPACAVAPVAVTLDELGQAWRNARVCLPLNITYDGAQFGRANGQEMKFGFDELIEHAAYSRNLPAGTILGSGTVANSGFAEVGSSCIAERRAIEMIAGDMGETPYMRHGSTVEMRVAGLDGQDLFGSIRQKVQIVG